MAPLSGVEAISPALEETQRQLLKPFLWGRWTRMALVSLLTGEMAVGVGIAFAMIDIAALIVLLIPILLMGLVVVLLGQAGGLTWNLLTIALAVLAGGVVAGGLLFVMAMLSVPVAVFFQAYALYFLGSPYPKLGEKMTIRAKTSPSPGNLPPASAPLSAS
ncbi:MAG: hypothetical protein DMG21_03355 [Acidobacteria bacterium]|nr:MAG: hypothetical protein DMG21_03355 [Acidobacteriota bacterium]